MIDRLRELPRGTGRVHLHIDGSFAELVIDHPKAMNAISIGMMVDIVDAVASLERWEGSVVLLHGTGGSFCAGGDLRAVREHLLDGEAAADMARTMGAALDRLSALPAVVVAAVEGAALGGGAELLTACDRVVAGRGARVGFVHASLGVSPGWGGGGRLVARVGPRRALACLVEAHRMSADSAREVGLVDEVVDDGAALSTARSWAQRVAAHPPDAVRAAVRIVRRWGAVAAGEAAVRADASEAERQAFSELWGGEAHRAALARLNRSRP